MSDSIFLTDGNGTITGLVDASYAGELVIPEYVGDERITMIGPRTFANCTSLSSIVIPNSVTELGDEAFLQSGLTSIVIPDSVINIGTACFHSCASLTSVTLSNGNCGLARAVFSHCTALTSITFPEEGAIYLDATFAGCTSLTSVTIPDSVAGIYDGFEGCTSLTTVYVPDPNNLSEGVNSCDWLSATGNEVVFLAIPVIKYLINEKTLTNLASKIRILSGEEDTMTPAEMGTELDEANQEVGVQAELIEQLIDALDGKAVPDNGGQTPSVRKNDVNFYDYDGTLLYSYTVEEAQALAELPPLPAQPGLTCQGWNYDLANIKSYNRAVNVGATYITDDGKTRIYITLQEGRTSPMLGVCPNGTVTVDWGDGTTPDTLTGTSTSTVKWTPNHAYAQPGDYVITLTVDGSMGLYGSSSTDQNSAILRHSASAATQNQVYQIAVQKIELGDSVTSIGAYAFCDCHSLASIVIPDSVTSIGAYAFYQCYSLASIVIPDGVTFIGNYTFYTCFSLASIVIPDSVTSIDTRAFNNCILLASIVIPDSVTSIGAYAFYNCYSLASIVIPDGVTSIAAYTFYNCYLLASIVIPDSVTSIGAYAFYNCYSLASIVIPDGVIVIGNHVFYNCFLLASIVIPDGVIVIGNHVFYNCYSLASIVIPDGVTSIAAYTFYNCYSLARLRFNRATPPTVPDSNAFSGIPTDCIISVPVGSLSAYTSATNYPSASTYTYIEED